jgi:CubicO group peptidase (beta-lactamase class C family)
MSSIKVIAVSVLFTSLAVSLHGQTIAQSPLTNELDKLISSGFKENEPGGVAFVAQKGKIIYLRPFGMANMELDVKMRPDMVFSIGSITKEFTSISILQLMEQGKLSLQDELTKYIPDYPVNGQKITIEHLLTHTAGIPGSPRRAADTLSRRGVKPEQLIGLFKNLPLQFPAGTQYSYSNSGYFLLGYIIEMVSGMSYANYLRKNIFTPASMKNTYYGDDHHLIKNRASSYLPGRNGFENANNGPIIWAYSAGGILSTVEDLYKFNRALYDYKLVKKETLDMAQQEHPLPNGKKSEYGYGWEIGNMQGTVIFEHGGNAGGFMTHDIYLPKEDIFVAVFMNIRDKLPELLATDLAATALGKPFNIKEVSLDENTLKSYVGVYVGDSVERYITVENGKMFYQRQGANKLSMRPYARDRFFFDNMSIIGEIKRDENDKIISLVLRNKRRKEASSNLIRLDKRIPAPDR